VVNLSNPEIEILVDVYDRPDDDGPPWTLSRFLDERYEIVGGPPPDISEAYYNVTRRLSGLGYLKELSLAADYGLTDYGIDAVREIRRQRSDPATRAASLRRGLMVWLYEADRKGRQTPTTQWFSGEESSFVGGERATDPDIQRAVAYLLEKGLIEGSQISQVRHLASPRLTALGVDCVESGSQVSEFLAGAQRAASTIYNVDAGQAGNVAIGTQGAVTQNYSASVDPQALTALIKFANVVREGLPALGLDQNQQAEASALSDELEMAACETAPDRGRLRQLGTRLLTAIGPATSAALSGMVAALGQEAVKSISG
jgi:hypothetical protein